MGLTPNTLGFPSFLCSRIPITGLLLLIFSVSLPASVPLYFSFFPCYYLLRIVHLSLCVSLHSFVSPGVSAFPVLCLVVFVSVSLCLAPMFPSLSLWFPGGRNSDEMRICHCQELPGRRGLNHGEVLLLGSAVTYIGAECYVWCACVHACVHMCVRVHACVFR